MKSVAVSVPIENESAQAELRDKSVPAGVQPPDVDELFPEPEIQRLLEEIAGDLNEVNRFLANMNNELAAERSPKPRFTLERRNRILKT